MGTQEKSDTPPFETTNKVVEIRTPNSTTRFHDPSDAIDFEREKYEEARKAHNRIIENIHVRLPGPRG